MGIFLLYPIRRKKVILILFLESFNKTKLKKISKINHRILIFDCVFFYNVGGFVYFNRNVIANVIRFIFRSICNIFSENCWREFFISFCNCNFCVWPHYPVKYLWDASFKIIKKIKIQKVQKSKKFILWNKIIKQHVFMFLLKKTP